MKNLKIRLLKNGLNIGITPYCFRHTFQDTLERSNVEKELRERLMGKLPASSLKHYTHKDFDRMKEAIDSLPSYTDLSQNTEENISLEEVEAVG